MIFLIEIDFVDKDIVKEILLDNHYILMCETPDKISFNKGYTANGYADKVFHIHIKNTAIVTNCISGDYPNDNDKKQKNMKN